MDTTTSILESVKKQLNIEQDTTEFDSDILSLVNGAFFSLYQVGVGGSTPFQVSDSSTTWGDISSIVPLDVILDYVVLKTKLIFDPPQSSQVVTAYQDRLSELEFRMSIEVDNGGGDVSG